MTRAVSRLSVGVVDREELRAGGMARSLLAEPTVSIDQDLRPRGELVHLSDYDLLLWHATDFPNKGAVPEWAQRTLKERRVVLYSGGGVQDPLMPSDLPRIWRPIPTENDVLHEYEADALLGWVKSRLDEEVEKVPEESRTRFPNILSEPPRVNTLNTLLILCEAFLLAAAARRGSSMPREVREAMEKLGGFSAQVANLQLKRSYDSDSGVRAEDWWQVFDRSGRQAIENRSLKHKQSRPGLEGSTPSSRWRKVVAAAKSEALRSSRATDKSARDQEAEELEVALREVFSLFEEGLLPDEEDTDANVARLFDHLRKLVRIG